MNQLFLVGRLTKDPEMIKHDGKVSCRITMAVKRSFKNPDGIYETDFFDCILWDGLAKNASEYCKKGDTIGVRGRLQTSSYEVDNIKRKAVEIVVEKLTFLSSRKTEPKEIDG